jgi:V/A-type H+-transporting ATPase subunit D
MSKIKYSEGELKRQRDNLIRYERFLPILELKRNLLRRQIEQAREAINSKSEEIRSQENEMSSWAGLLAEAPSLSSGWITPQVVQTTDTNIAGVIVPAFRQVDFREAEYDMFLTPPWMEIVLRQMRYLVILREQKNQFIRQLGILEGALGVTTQRINLFDKVKIPECKENIRHIKIYLGDQQANAVGRSKIVKKKSEKMAMAGGNA